MLLRIIIDKRLNMKKILVFTILALLLSTIANPAIKAENKKLIDQTTFVVPITGGSFRDILIPFHQIYQGDSNFQIKVLNDLPLGFGIKIGLGGKFVQKDWEIGPIKAGAEDMLSLRIFCPQEVQPAEIYAKILIGSTEDSSISSIINLYLQPVDKREFHLQINSKIVDGLATSLDTPPIIIKGRTFVPFRFIGEQLGAKISYTVSPSTKKVETVTFKLGRKSILLTIGSNQTEITNDKEKTTYILDAPPVIISGRTLVPLRFVSEALGATITWDGKTSKIGVFFPQTDPVPTDNGSIFYHVVTTEELHTMIENKDKKFLIDIRVDSEYKKGHIPTAENIYESKLTEEYLATRFSKSDTIILYCNSGLRSILFCEMLTNLGYTNVYNLSKGFSGWRYPTEK
jgi:rhodanese-related sulfurtransferase